MADVEQVQAQEPASGTPIPAADREKMRSLEAERDSAKAEADDLRARVKDLEARMKEADARRIMETAVAGGKLAKEAVEAAGSPWLELAMMDAGLAERIISTLPAKVGNVNAPLRVAEPQKAASGDDAKLAKARELVDREGISLFEALERMD
jgi:chromosome segregation ATPase